ncbi:MAG TPA: hypothetical protein VK184_21580 [Nostocaceae cyanobacterium]|nr:hypothetical protein [Nostocaceae cyanobacterium]
MNESQSTKLLNELLLQNPSDVKVWLKRVWLDQEKVPEEFNWLGLAEAAAFEARSGERNVTNTSNIFWAEIAISVYDYLASQANSGTGESFIISSMLLRAAMIADYGSVFGHPVLDSNQIIHWFFHSLKMSLDEVIQNTANWKDNNIENIRELRRIKNRLKVILVLTESDKFKPDEELKAWLSLREKLP